MEMRNAAGEIIFKIDPNTGKIVKENGADFVNQGGPHSHSQGDITNLATDLAAKQASSEKGQANGYASLGADGKVPSAQLPASSGSSPQFMVPVVVNAITYTNAPSGGLEPAGQQSRVQVDLRGAVNVVAQALCSVIPHAASGKLHCQYSTDGGTNWSTLIDLGTGGYTANVLKISTATAVPAGAKVASCLLRVIAHGDGVVDPVCQKFVLMFQPA